MLVHAVRIRRSAWKFPTPGKSVPRPGNATWPETLAGQVKRSFDMNTQRFSDRTALRFVPLVLLVVAGIPEASADSTGYTFQKITTLATPCTPAPGGGFFQFDFEPWGINSRGDLAFAADFTNTNKMPCGPGKPYTSDGEGVFLSRK